MSRKIMNISVPSAMQEFVAYRVKAGRYGSTSEYIRDLIRSDQQRLIR